MVATTRSRSLALSLSYSHCLALPLSRRNNRITAASQSGFPSQICEDVCCGSSPVKSFIPAVSALITLTSFSQE
ncbi:hypothetical protein JOB18_016415 [Solea senegalensis]|uniref:Secreted protein n=1 Tax=Solea senegalensis TaxID=28829 RepID=A0AAV6PIS5_SOLSE|nr:hypothetical protein JOB18_016415 [Solea senegalensis]